MNDPLKTLKEWEQKELHLRKIAERILEIFPDGVVAIDSDRTICLVNEQIEFMFGYPRNELLGEKVEIFLPVNLATRHAQHIAGYFDDPKTRVMGSGIILKGKKKNGKEFPVEIMLSPLMTDFGQFAIAVIRKPKDIAKEISHG